MRKCDNLASQFVSMSCQFNQFHRKPCIIKKLKRKANHAYCWCTFWKKSFLDPR